jgi:hypothetical protein
MVFRDFPFRLKKSRPDLAQEIFNDQLSLYQAGKLMRAEPAKWKPKRRSRTSQVTFNPSSGADNDLLPRVLALEIGLRELIQQLVPKRSISCPRKITTTNDLKRPREILDNVGISVRKGSSSAGSLEHKILSGRELTEALGSKS